MQLTFMANVRAVDHENDLLSHVRCVIADTLKELSNALNVDGLRIDL